MLKPIENKHNNLWKHHIKTCFILKDEIKKYYVGDVEVDAKIAINFLTAYAKYLKEDHPYLNGEINNMNNIILFLTKTDLNKEIRFKKIWYSLKRVDQL